MVHIYILQLIKNKYYIGKSCNPEIRINEHFTDYGSQWTQTYKPIKVIEIISNCDDYDEDKYVIKYMEKYGIENVRVGSFSETKLSSENKRTLEQM